MIRAVARALVAAGLAVQACGLAAQAPKQEELRELRQRIDRLKERLDAAESARTDAADALRASETAISEANRRLRELGAERDKVQAELTRITTEAGTLRAHLDGRQSELARLLQARYTEGERSFLRVLLSGGDPQRIARGLVYQSYLARAQAKAIEELHTDLERLRVLEGSVRSKSAALAEIEAQSRAERDALHTRAAERRRVLAQASDEIRRSRRDLSAAQRNEARLARLVEEIARAARPTPRPRHSERDAAPVVGTFGGLKGRLRTPVRGDFAGRFGGSSRSASPSPKGLFIRAPEGAEVRAVAPGRVVFADWMRGYGNLLILDHGDGYLSIYGNNESVLKRVGEGVHAGDTVATVGASGGNDTSGLYFELRHQGKAFDPMPWLQAK